MRNKHTLAWPWIVIAFACSALLTFYGLSAVRPGWWKAQAQTKVTKEVADGGVLDFGESIAGDVRLVTREIRKVVVEP